MSEQNEEERRAKLRRDYLQKRPTAARVRIRPHHLLCLLCVAGNEGSAPSPKNTAFHILQRIKADPDVEIEIWKGVDDVCIGCPSNAGGRCTAESATRDLRKDQDTLEKTGLEFGAVIPAREVYALVMRHIPHVAAVCTYEHPDPPVWRDCASARSGHYENAVKKGLWHCPARAPESPRQG